MAKITTSPTIHFPKQYENGTFRVTEVQRGRFSAALNIAKRMRVQGDESLEDAVRAVEILRGGGYLDHTWDMVEAEDDDDHERQANAYYDGVGELDLVLNQPKQSCNLCGCGGSC